MNNLIEEKRPTSLARAQVAFVNSRRAVYNIYIYLYVEAHVKYLCLPREYGKKNSEHKRPRSLHLYERHTSRGDFRNRLAKYTILGTLKFLYHLFYFNDVLSPIYFLIIDCSRR